MSSGTLPSRDDGTVSAPIACLRSSGRSALRAQVHLVLLAALVVGRHLIAADQQPQRLGRVADLHAEVGGLRPVDAAPTSSGLPTFSDVSTSTTPGIVFTALDELRADTVELLQVRPVDR